MNPFARQAAAARRRRRTLLTRLLAAALVAVVLISNYRLHVAGSMEDWEDDALWDEPSNSISGSGSGSGGGALAGLRSWLSSSASRRSLREGPPGTTDPGLAAHVPPWKTESTDPGADAAGAFQFERWWILDGYAQVTAPQLELAQLQQQQLEQQQQQLLGGAGQGWGQEEDEGEDIDGLEGLAGRQSGDVEVPPVQRLLALKRLEPSAFKLYNFKEKRWVQHNLTRIPVEVPVARWAVASLLNKAKKKESIIFLLGGYASMKEVAGGRPPRPPKTDAGGSMTLRTAGVAAASLPATCPLASANVYAVNTGRSKFLSLPPLPEARYGGAAVVAGARLHFLGGWATPDRVERLAQPAGGHWSIGLNADGSSAPDWQEELQLPAELLGRRLSVSALQAEEDGEPQLFVWTDGSSDTAASGSGEAACAAGHSADEAAAADGGSSGGKAVQLWSYGASSSWLKRGPLPQPLADDIQCAVAASPHEILAVGSVERSGIFTSQRGLWQYDARNGGTWARAGWAPVKFAGRLCAMYHTRLFISGGLPSGPAPLSEAQLGLLPDLAAEVAELEAEVAEAEAADSEAEAAESEAEQAAKVVELAAEIEAAVAQADSEAAEAAVESAELQGQAAAAAAEGAAAAAEHAEAGAAELGTAAVEEEGSGLDAAVGAVA